MILNFKYLTIMTSGFIESLKSPEFIFGSLITIAIGIIGIIYAKRVRLSEITFLPDQFIFLVDNILNEYKDIQILYKQKLVDKNIGLFKGSFINTGKDDIDLTIAEKNLKIDLPEGSSIIKAEISAKSKDLEIKISETSNNTIEFIAGLFKRNEFFSIEAIISLPQSNNIKKVDSKNLYSIINFKHRVKNFKKIKRLGFDLKTNDISNNSITNVLVIIALSISVFTIGFFNPRHIAPLTRNSSELTYVLFDSVKNDSISTIIIPYSRDSIELIGLNNNFKKIVSVNGFLKNLNITPKIIKVMDDNSIRTRVNSVSFVSFITLACMLIILIRAGIELRKKKRIRKLLED
jgi:hypothetical protein